MPCAGGGRPCGAEGVGASGARRGAARGGVACGAHLLSLETGAARTTVVVLSVGVATIVTATGTALKKLVAAAAVARLGSILAREAAARVCVLNSTRKRMRTDAARISSCT